MKPELRDIPAPGHVRLTDRVERFRGPIFTIFDDEIEFAAGDRARRQWMNHDDAVAIVALRPSESPGEDWDVLLIRQYRHAPRRIMWEIPAGLRDAEGEAEVLTAARELQEETDYVATSWYRVINFVTSPGVSDEDLGVFLAFDLTHRPSPSFTRREEEAEIVVEWCGLNAVTNAVLRQELSSPSLVAGILAANVSLSRGLKADDEVRLPLTN
ncbi:NUDIX domain-containing protein [Trueperella bernardiae]|uniref:NUDIX domain-containing protein n=1 Tax=Trueperella bernardiae TaxID=59561 RepID=UPI0009F30F2E|nr:NUDIX hydrolase [Trueperella bernardiae]MCM3906697.1 NUDIX hydrolase [Trueperella bernardiae]WIM08863.1 NUDIX hydrolase [Trueperella bernardiae]